MSDSVFMLDTNTVSYIIRGQFPSVRERLQTLPLTSVCISAITEAELLRDLAKHPTAKHLHSLVNEFLLRVESLPWNTAAAIAYAKLRTEIEKSGKTFGTMDMLIAAHSSALGSVLVTNDKAFGQIKDYVQTMDWTIDGSASQD